MQVAAVEVGVVGTLYGSRFIAILPQLPCCHIATIALLHIATITLLSQWLDDEHLFDL